jgi:hypothetical protein
VACRVFARPNKGQRAFDTRQWLPSRRPSFLGAACRQIEYAPDWTLEPSRPGNVVVGSGPLVAKASATASAGNVWTSFAGLGLRLCAREGGQRDQQRTACRHDLSRARRYWALAQTYHPGSQGTTPSTYQPVHKATAPAADQPADMFVTKQAVTEWRACKLVGLSVYGVDDKIRNYQGRSCRS